MRFEWHRLPAQAGGAPPAPVQRQPDPAAEAARKRQDAETASWMGVVMRPDLHGGPVQCKSEDDSAAANQSTASAGQRAWQRAAWELKVWRDKNPDPLEQGLAPLDVYLAGLGLDRGILVLFGRRASAAPLAERIGIAETRTPEGRAVTVLRA